MSNIPSTPVDGNLLVLVVPTVANMKAPTVAELSGATAKNISCYLTGDGLNEAQDEATIADSRLCDTFEAELPGRLTPSLELTYIDNTNSDNEDDSNDAVKALPHKQEAVVAIRQGIPWDTAVAETQKFRLYKIKAGVQKPVQAEANSVFRANQKEFVQDYEGAAVVAPTAP